MRSTPRRCRDSIQANARATVGARRRNFLLPDTHSHLDASVFDEDRDAVVTRALHAGVDRILVVGTDLVSSTKAVSIARQYDAVYAAVGIDPHNAGRFDADCSAVEALLDEEKVVAVGEIGLDYERVNTPRREQRRIFKVQVRWAADRGIAVSVHNRGADRDVARELYDTRVRSVLHCFSSGPGFAEVAVSRGWYLSFAGNVTFWNAGPLQETARGVPLPNTLVESDSPVLTPQPWRGKRNEPAYVCETARVLADVQHLDLQRLCEGMTQNADAVFRWRTR